MILKTTLYELNEIEKEFLKLKEDNITDSTIWLEFTSKINQTISSFVQQVVQTKDVSYNQDAIRACTLGLISAQKIGKLHPVIGQITFQAGLLYYQSHQF